MGETESYLLNIKNDFLKKASHNFILYLSVNIASFVIAYAISSFITYNGTFFVLAVTTKGSISLWIKSFLSSQIPLAIQLSLLFCSAFTYVNKSVSAVIFAWRGICLGAVLDLISEGAIQGGNGATAVALVGYFLATLLLIVFASVASVYSKAIAHTILSDKRRYILSLTTELIKYFLILSGAIFTLCCVNVILF